MLLVRDIKASVRFYKETLGLTGDTAGPWAEFRSKGCRIVLLDRGFWAAVTRTRVASSPKRPRASVVLAIQVPNVTKLYRTLRRRRVRFELAPRDIPEMGNRVALIADPDGNLVELSTMLG